MKPVRYLAILLLPFAAASCGMNPTDHNIPGTLNLEREEFGPDHHLYLHHTIMLEEEFNEAFGMVADRKVELTAAEAELLMQEGASKKKSSSTPWKQRVYPKDQWHKVNVFDLSGIEPKERATRPSWTSDKEHAQRCHKPLRQREIYRLGPDGKVTKSYKRAGTVI